MSQNGSRVRARAKIDILLKSGIADPQGQTVEAALPDLGYGGVSDVRVGKHLELLVEADSLDEASRRVDDMCRGFLSNPVIETYAFTLEPA